MSDKKKYSVIYRVVSGKGGVGKSFISSTLAYALADKGHKTLFIDLDTGLRNVDLVLGLRERVVYNLFDVAEKGMPLKNAVVKGIGREGENVPDFLFCDNTKTKNAVSMRAVSDLLSEAVKEYDAIVLDSPAGVEYGFKMAARISVHDEDVEIKCCTLIVSTPEIPVLNTAHSIANRLAQPDEIDEQGEEYKSEPVYLVLNRCIPELADPAIDGGVSPQEAAQQIMVPLIGAVPMDIDVVRCANQGKPVWVYRPKSAPRAVISGIADILIKEFYKAPEPEQPAEAPKEPVKEPEPVEPKKPEEPKAQEEPESKPEPETEPEHAPAAEEAVQEDQPEQEPEQEEFPGAGKYKPAESAFGEPPASMSLMPEQAVEEEKSSGGIAGFISKVFRSFSRKK